MALAIIESKKRIKGKIVITATSSGINKSVVEIKSK